MAYPKRVKGTYVTILMGNGASPEVFVPLCGLTTRSLTAQINGNDEFVKDCANPEDVPVRAFLPTGKQWDVSGSGVIDRNSIKSIIDAQGYTKNYRFMFGEPINDQVYSGYWAGPGVLTNVSFGGNDDAFATVELTVVSDGLWEFVEVSSGGVSPTPISISGTPPTTGQVGTPYSFTPSTANGIGVKTFALSSGTLLGGLSFSTSTGAISGTPTVSGTMSNLVVTVTDSTGSASTTATSVTIAAPSNQMTVLFVGSSTPDKYFTEFTGPSNSAVTSSSDGNTFSPLGTTGAGATNFGNRLNTLTGKNIRLIKKGVSGTTLADWEADGSAQRAAAVAAVLAAGGVDAIVSIVGFNDAQYSNGVVTSTASHAAKLRSFFAKLRSEIGQPNAPILIGGSQEYNGTASYVDDKFTFVRAAEITVAEEIPNRWYAHAYDLAQLSDGIHQAAASYPIHAFRGAANVAAVFGGGVSVKGPSVTAVTAVYNTTTDVTITHDGGTDFTPTSGAVTGFALSFDGFANGAQINSATRLSATKVRLLHTASGGAAPSVQLLRGARPDISGVIKDNSTLTLPINPTKGIVTAPSGSNTVDPGVTPTPTPTPTGPLNDTFTDTDNVALSAHVPESGHTWTDVNSAFKIIQNAAIGTTLGNARSSWAPASSAYGLTANLRFRTDTGNTLLLLHVQDDSNYYWAGCVGGNRWQIGRTVTGSPTVLQNVAASRTAGTSYALDFSITSAGVITLKVDGATIATVTDTTSSLSATGAAGMRQSAAAASTTASAYFLDIAGYAL